MRNNEDNGRNCLAQGRRANIFARRPVRQRGRNRAVQANSNRRHGICPDRLLHAGYDPRLMTRPPMILVSPNIEKKGDEFGDVSISLSETYQQALMRAGALPMAMPAALSRSIIAECVERADGVLLTGGEDLNPRLYSERVPSKLRKTVNVTPDCGGRDYREMVLVDEVFRQRKPLLAVCRGHQVLNVALGGTLYVDIKTERPEAINHRRMDRRSEMVHEVQLTPGSLLAKITGGQRLGVNSTHHQAVARVAAPLAATAVSDDGIVEGLELKPGAADWLPFLLSVQFHPERLAGRYPAHRAIFESFARACAPGGLEKL
jgi:putative glutamine amidotransferase